MPFTYDNKALFGLKVVLFLGSGFAIPFAAAAFQLYVSLERFLAVRF